MCVKHAPVFSVVGVFGGHKNSTFYVKSAISPEGRYVHTHMYMYVLVHIIKCHHGCDRCMGVQRYRHRVHIPCTTVKT